MEAKTSLTSDSARFKDSKIQSNAVFPPTWKSVSAPTGPNYAKSEETLQSGTEKSHNGHASDTTSRTTIICACDGDDEDDDGYEDDDSSCDCECEPPSCQVQCCCVSCCPPPDTCNFFRIPPPMPYQQSFQQNGCQGAPPCMTQPQPSCDNQQFSQGKHLEEKWEKEQTEMKVCYCSSYRCAFGPKTRCGPSCTIKVTKQQTKTTKQEIRREGPPSTTSANPAQRCYSGDGNHCPDGCTNWCNCDARMNQNITCYTPPRVVPNIPQLSSGYAIPCVNPMIGIPCHTNNCDPENGGCR
ncbi:unnamed protein product [Callosobruchus maculatus]|uniref:Uncharacterized protein n=1 Tax=Callosobruchus maculatus TaxID=64391 RepID=A0A653D3B3_CALMS|nr:unnamed protein product [Callosobruchus maculatus]